MDDKLDPYIEFVERCAKNWRWACRYLFGQDHSFDLLSFQHSALNMFFSHSFPLLVGSRGASKTTLLGIYAILKAIFSQDLQTGAKIVIVGSGFRQAKEVFGHIENLWATSPIIQECAPDGPHTLNDRCELRIGNSIIIAVPLGDGTKIRGLRATSVLADEIDSIPEHIFNVVVRGFAAVAQNPVQRVQMYKKLKDAGVPKERISRYLPKNQIILTGTAGYKFKHFYKTYDRYLNIIENRFEGPASQLDESFSSDVDAHIDFRDYAVMKLPYTNLPDGFLDETMVASSRINMSKTQFDMEFNAEFADDSEGFFSRRLIEECKPKEEEMALDPSDFNIELKGDPDGIYAMGIDPARTRDNLVICITRVLENRIKPCFMYSMKGKSFVKAAHNIVKLFKLFNIQLIEMDNGGGGQAIRDILQAEDFVKEGDPTILELIDETQQTGDRVLELVNYQGKWLRQANYTLKADFQHRKILFPVCIGEEKFAGMDYSADRLERNKSPLEAANISWEEIEESKNETSNIVRTTTTKTEEEHFDVPKTPGMKTTRRKDRYSALLMAVDAAHRIIKGDIEVKFRPKLKPATGGWVQEGIK